MCSHIVLTFGSYIFKWQLSSKSFLRIPIAGDSLVSFVFDLKAKPSIEIFFPARVPNKFLTTKVTKIGFFSQGSGVEVRDRENKIINFSKFGFSHF